MQEPADNTNPLTTPIEPLLGPAVPAGPAYLPVLRIIGLLSAVVAVIITGKMFVDGANPSSVSLNGGTSASSGYKFSAGSPAPDFELTNLDGKAVKLSDFRGQPVMVNFWATWCPPCRSEMPDMEQLYREQKEQGLVILAINMQEANDPIKQFANKYGLTFPILTDVSGSVSQQFGVQSLPSSYFIDAQGRVATFNFGAMNKSGLASRIAMASKE